MITRATIAIGATLVASPAFADAGHIVHAGGHAHWELLAELAVIAALGVPLVLRALRRRR